MAADEVARIGFDGWEAGRRVVIPGVGNRGGAFGVRLLPRRLVSSITRRLNET